MVPLAVPALAVVCSISCALVDVSIEHAGDSLLHTATQDTLTVGLSCCVSHSDASKLVLSRRVMATTTMASPHVVESILLR